jgi:hypothetical protein
MLFLFNLVYASTWGTVAFLIPTEIFPSRMRAQGNGFGITGWAIGVGWTVLVNPIMFEHLEVCIQQDLITPFPHQLMHPQSRTYFLFAALNFIWIGIVYLVFPETAGRSLESTKTCLPSPTSKRWKVSTWLRRSRSIVRMKSCHMFDEATTGEAV